MQINRNKSTRMKQHPASNYNTAQNSFYKLPSYLQTKIIAQMLSIGP